MIFTSKATSNLTSRHEVYLKSDPKDELAHVAGNLGQYCGGILQAAAEGCLSAKVYVMTT